MTIDGLMKSGAGAGAGTRRRVGDLVRVKGLDDILATLDDRGRLDGLPFMPEMLAFAGQTLTIDAVVHRTCDTVKTSGTSGTTRQMPNAVHLTDARCDGSAHGGCQARCLLYWKEEWLEVADPLTSSTGTRVGSVPDVLQNATHGDAHTAADPVFACQATELLQATCFVSPRNPRPWVDDIVSRNATLRTALISATVLAFNKWQRASRRFPKFLRIHGGESWPSYRPSGERRNPQPLKLKAGELVEVKSQAEIEATLDDKGALRGLRFAAEMLPFCGKQARVLSRVDRIIDEKTGRMLKLRDCLILEDVWCEGTFRALCRRKIYTYWREAWLRRVEPQGGQGP